MFVAGPAPPVVGIVVRCRGEWVRLEDLCRVGHIGLRREDSGVFV